MPAISASIRRRLFVYARRSISVLQRYCRNAANRYFVRRSCKVWLYMHARACCKTGAGGTHARCSVSVLQQYCRNAASHCIPYHLLKKSPPQIYFTAAIKNRNFLLQHGSKKFIKGSLPSANCKPTERNCLFHILCSA